MPAQRVRRQFPEQLLVLVREMAEMPEASGSGGFGHRVDLAQHRADLVQAPGADERGRVDAQCVLEAVPERVPADAEVAPEVQPKAC